MKLPYKYPYLSIFILGYYFLEHEGYYYKLRNLLGYSVDQQINYVASLNDQKFSSIVGAPGRKSVVFYSNKKDNTKTEDFIALARSFKEKLRSPLVFGERFCTKDEEICLKNHSPFVALYLEGKVVKLLEGEMTKKKLKKRIKEFSS